MLSCAAVMRYPLASLCHALPAPQIALSTIHLSCPPENCFAIDC
jgi:hypothetical protein